MVLEGLIYPEPDELNNAIARNLFTPYQYDSIVKFKGYPRAHSCEANNLQCPKTGIEGPGTLPATYGREPTTTPDAFIALEPFNEENLTNYASAETPQEMRELERKRLAIGNAISFSRWIILNSINKSNNAIVFMDWNLDSDRGYEYKCWYWGTQKKFDRYITLKMV